MGHMAEAPGGPQRRCKEYRQKAGQDIAHQGKIRGLPPVNVST